ncbi:cytidine deaminase [Flavobacterium sufflavum]|uniref:Cytidine deaminase n=1 Tax=Flavobacterium sufflavum TaxID=1921138 RepID=A0A3S2V3Z3_9FLAO|nr:cytidine deaminase [Flavobacterium sufflavum]RVT75723.1 cytidine deaminase [Flavobacterium sufflavum]
MEEVIITSKFTIYNTIEELPIETQNLFKQAAEAQKNAHAPYSKFRVGAALSLDNGKIILGSNQENAAYPSGLCAERVALYQAASNFPESKILKIVITAAPEATGIPTAIPPCGACRQSIAEYEIKQDSPIKIYFMGEIGKIYKSESLKNLLPLIFNKKLL